jgi:transcriptional regulator
MYLPEHFRESDAGRALALVEAHPFGQLITAPDGVPFVSHLPFLLLHDCARPRLLGHLARANPQWRHFAPGCEVLTVFQGPHAYVSPGWYTSPGGVPTWNYAVVHLRGVPRVVEDVAELEALLNALTRIHEADLPEPWRADLTPERKARLFEMVVGFEIEVSDIQAKFKLSQNRPEDDRRQVAAALARSGSDAAAAVARLMDENR